MARLIWLLGMAVLGLACDPPTHVILHARCAAAAGCVSPAVPNDPSGPATPVPGTPGCPVLEACPPGAQCACSVRGAQGVEACSELCPECPPSFETRVIMSGGCPTCRCVACTRDQDCPTSERCVAAEPCDAECVDMDVECCHGNRCEPVISEPPRAS